MKNNKSLKKNQRETEKGTKNEKETEKEVNRK